MSERMKVVAFGIQFTVNLFGNIKFHHRSKYDVSKKMFMVEWIRIMSVENSNTTIIRKKKSYMEEERLLDEW